MWKGSSRSASGEVGSDAVRRLEDLALTNDVALENSSLPPLSSIDLNPVLPFPESLPTLFDWEREAVEVRRSAIDWERARRSLSSPESDSDSDSEDSGERVCEEVGADALEMVEFEKVTDWARWSMDEEGEESVESEESECAGDGEERGASLR